MIVGSPPAGPGSPRRTPARSPSKTRGERPPSPPEPATPAQAARDLQAEASEERPGTPEREVARTVARLRGLVGDVDARHRGSPADAAAAFLAALRAEAAPGPPEEAASAGPEADAQPSEDGAAPRAAGDPSPKRRKGKSRPGPGRCRLDPQRVARLRPDGSDPPGLVRLERAIDEVEQLLERGRRGDTVAHHEGARRCHALLFTVAHGDAALALAVDRRLARLARDDRVLQLGKSCIWDYARDVLDRAKRTTEADLELARGLETRPLLRRAVLAGEIDLRKARTVLPAAKGAQEAAWVERARTTRTTELAVLVHDAGFPASLARSEEDQFAPICARMTPGQRRRYDWGMEAAGLATGRPDDASRLEATFQEVLGTYGVLGEDDEDDEDAEASDARDGAGEAAAASSASPGEDAHQDASPGCDAPADASHDETEASPNRKTKKRKKKRYPIGPGPAPDLGPAATAADFLGRAEPTGAPPLDPGILALLPAEVRGEWPSLDGLTAEQLDRQIRELALIQHRWDELYGRLAWLAKEYRIARVLGAPGFDAYCTDRLGAVTRTVRRRLKLHRALRTFAALAQAYREGRIGYTKALHVARHTPRNASPEELRAAIAEAEVQTALDLQRQHDKERKRTIDAEGKREAWVPPDVHELYEAARRTVRIHMQRRGVDNLSDAEILCLMLDHMDETWGYLRACVDKKRQALFDRTDGYCAVPGCSQVAKHRHHIVYRSRQGSDAEENLIGLCSPHHLHCLHFGWLRLTGRAGEELVFEFGLHAPGRRETWVMHGFDPARRTEVDQAPLTPPWPDPDAGPWVVREPAPPAYGLAGGREAPAAPESARSVRGATLRGPGPSASSRPLRQPPPLPRAPEHAA